MSEAGVEVDVVYEGEVELEDKPEWEALISEWADAGSRVFRGQLRQARAAANVVRHYGRGAMEEFAKAVGVSKSTVYDYARAYICYGHLYEDENSGRLESAGLLTISHLIEASYAPDPIKMLERAEDEKLSRRQIKRLRQEESEPPNVETVEMARCPHCEKSFALSQAVTWTEASEA